MKNGTLSVCIIVLMIGILIESPRAQEEIDLLEASGLEDNQRSGVIFLHDEHNEAAEIDECNECHHVYEDGQKLEDESSEDLQCADCHEKTSVGSVPGLREAFHLNCKGCHMQVRKGPVMCGQCHER